MVGYCGILDKIYWKSRIVSRNLDFEKYMITSIKELLEEHPLHDRNREKLESLYQMTQPVIDRGLFEWTVWPENNGIEIKRRDEFLICFNRDLLDKKDPNILPFLIAFYTKLREFRPFE